MNLLTAQWSSRRRADRQQDNQPDQRVAGSRASPCGWSGCSARNRLRPKMTSAGASVDSREVRHAKVGLDEGFEAGHRPRAVPLLHRSSHQAEVDRTDHGGVRLGQLEERTMAQPDLLAPVAATAFGSK